VEKAEKESLMQQARTQPTQIKKLSIAQIEPTRLSRSTHT